MKNPIITALKSVALFSFIAVFGLTSTANAQIGRTASNVPNEYYANYKFIEDWNQIWNTFNEIKSRYDLNMNIDSSYFSELSSYFRRSFQYLTKDYSTVYTKCQLLADELSNGASRLDVQ